MKALLALVLTFSAVSANAFLDSHYGKLSRRGNVYTCNFTNKSNRPLDMKYVDFSFVRVGGHGGSDFNVTNRIDHVVRPGESIAYSTSPNYVQSAFYCRYLAR